MKTRLVALLTFCLSLLGCAECPVERFRACVGHLRVVLDNGRENLGTVFAVSPRCLVTAAHTRIHEGQPHRVIKVIVDGHVLPVLGTETFGVDGMILRVAPVPSHLRILECGVPGPRKTDVFVPGYAIRQGLPSYRIKRGHILSDRAVSALIEGGMSGSPVIDARTGRVVAIASSYYPNLGITEFTPMEEPDDSHLSPQ